MIAGEGFSVVCVILPHFQVFGQSEENTRCCFSPQGVWAWAAGESFQAMYVKVTPPPPTLFSQHVY